MTDTMLRTLVDTVEYLVPSLHEVLKWDPIEFGPIFPEYCASPVASTAALIMPSSFSNVDPLKSADKEANLQHREPSPPASIIA